MTYLNQTQFAKHIGKSKGYVSQLKASGRLVFDEDEKLVDVEQSIQLIKDTADSNRDDVAARHAANRVQKTATETENEGTQKEDEATDLQKIKFSEGRALEQHYKALRAQMEFLKESGELVYIKDMEMALSHVFIVFRQSVENMPNLLAPILVNKDLEFIRASIRENNESYLKELSLNLKKIIEERVAP